jgi:hypothetical protein
MNRLIRQYISKKRDFMTIDEKDVELAMERLNNRPRKCLGFRSPFEIFLVNLLHFRVEFRENNSHCMPYIPHTAILVELSAGPAVFITTYQNEPGLRVNPGSWVIGILLIACNRPFIQLLPVCHWGNRYFSRKAWRLI